MRSFFFCKVVSVESFGEGAMKAGSICEYRSFVPHADQVLEGERVTTFHCGLALHFTHTPKCHSGQASNFDRRFWELAKVRRMEKRFSQPAGHGRRWW